MEEYGYAVVTPYGYLKGVHTKILSKLIHEGFSSKPLKTLISDIDFSVEDLQILDGMIKSRGITSQLKKGSINTVSVILVRGIDATTRLKNIVIESNQGLSFEEDNKNVLNVYVSNNNQEAIEDFCESLGVESFDDIEKYLIEGFSEKEVRSFNFKDLSKTKSK